MAYITTTLLNDRLGDALYARLTDRDNGAVADALVAQQIVDEAEATANGYLARRYATPIDLTARPELANVLKARVLDIAEYLAWKTSPFFGEVPVRVQTSYQDSTRWFAGVAEARLDLPASAAPAGRTAGSDAARFTAETRTFTRDELDGL